MTLELIKVQEGMCDGPVLFHALKSKTEEEVLEGAAKRQARVDAKEGRRSVQEANVERKRAAKQEKKQEKAARNRSREGAAGSNAGSDDEYDVDGGEQSGEQGGEQGGADELGPTDAEWYEREVGVAPEPGMFSERRAAPKAAKEEPSRKHKIARGGRAAQ